MASAVAFALLLLPFSAVEGTFGVQIFGPQFSPFGISQSNGWTGLKSDPTRREPSESPNSEYSHALYPLGKHQFLRIPVKGGLKVVPAPKNLEIFKETHDFLKHVPLVKRPPLTILGGYHFQDSSHALKYPERPLITVPGSGNSIILIHGHPQSHHSQLHSAEHLDGVSVSGIHSPIKISKSILGSHLLSKSHPVIKLKGISPLISSHHKGHSYPSLIHKTTHIEDIGVKHDLAHSLHHGVGESLLHGHKSDIGHSLLSSHNSDIGHELSHAHHSDIEHDLSHDHHSDAEHDLTHDHPSDIKHDLSHDHHSSIGHGLVHEHHSSIGHDLPNRHSDIGHGLSHEHHSDIGHGVHDHKSVIGHDVDDHHSHIGHDVHDHHSDIGHEVHDQHSDVEHDVHHHDSDIEHDIHDHHSDIEHGLSHGYHSDIGHHHDHSTIGHILSHDHTAHIKHGYHSIHDSDHSDIHEDDEEEIIDEHGLDVDDEHHESLLHEPHIEDEHNSSAKKIRDYKLLKLAKKIRKPITKAQPKIEEKPADEESDKKKYPPSKYQKTPPRNVKYENVEQKRLEDLKEEMIEQIKEEILLNMKEELIENMNKKAMKKMKGKMTGSIEEKLEDIIEQTEDMDEKTEDIDEKLEDMSDKLDHVPIPRPPHIKFINYPKYTPKRKETSKGHFPEGGFKRFQTSHHRSIIHEKKDFRKLYDKPHVHHPSPIEEAFPSHPYIPKILKSHEAMKYSGGRHPIRPVHKYAEQSQKSDEEKPHIYFRQVPLEIEPHEQLQEDEEPKHEMKSKLDSYGKVQSHSHHESRHSKPVHFEYKSKMALPRGRSKIYRNYEQPRTSSYAVEIQHSRRNGNAKKDVEDHHSAPKKYELDQLETQLKEDEEVDFDYLESQLSITKDSLDEKTYDDKLKEE